ncbi:MAG: MurG-like transferase [Candidatus Berkelbacteria bacterium]|nr:MurG-like transferase [Candidatus Berkelbacteria bacterium]
MKKILIVSLKAGNGHVQAARAIEVALKEKHPDFEVKNIDLLDYASILSREFYGNWYMDLVNAVPKFYEFMYERLDARSTKLRLLSDRMSAQKFQKFVFNFNPDLIFATHFVPGNLLTFWREKYKKNYKIITTLTDYEAHPLWIDNKFDLYTVASEEVKDQMINLGAEKEKIFVTGIPIDKKFSQKFDKSKIFSSLGLENKFTIALFAGAFGTGPMIDIFQNILNLNLDFQTIIVAGKNEDLKNKLIKMSEGKKTKTTTLGFIDNMEEIMAASDIAVSKAGGLTVSESLAINLPLVIINPYPGQEEANTKYLLKNLCAFKADSPSDTAELIKNVLKKPELIKEMRANIKKIAKPNAAFEIVELAEGFLD